MTNASPDPLERLAELVAERVAPALIARIDEAVTEAPRCLSVRQAGERLGVSERTVRDMVARGELPALKVAGSRRVLAADVAAYIEVAKARERAGHEGETMQVNASSGGSLALERLRS